MGDGSVRDDRLPAFVGKPTIADVGIGVLYFFTSHMVIRALYYVGCDRSSVELVAFLLIVVVSVACAHLLWRPLLQARLFVESVLGFPAVSAVAALGAALALVSMLPVVGVSLFYVSGALLGLSCGWIVVIWTSTMNAARPDASSFRLHPALLVAVAAYFLFRLVSTFSATIAEGFLLALPLVTIACILRGSSRTSDREPDGGLGGLGERAQDLQVLVVVAAAFAIGCGVAVSASGREGDALQSGLNYMVLFEVLAVALMGLCMAVMRRVARLRPALPPSAMGALTFCVTCLPLFLIGTIMGGAGIPETSPDALWESNIWVLIIAIFAYDIRDSLYVVDGLALGLMFEAMCIGQVVARMATLQPASFSTIAYLGLAALYFAGICWQLARGSSLRPKPAKSAAKTVGKGVGQATRALVAPSDADAHVDGNAAAYSEAPIEKDEREDSQADDEADDRDMPSELSAYCGRLAAERGLTPREAEILGLIAMGRSATYIAEELTISHNTTRTHIKHVYEKLGIHSKQELIDLVLFGSGLM